MKSNTRMFLAFPLALALAFVAAIAAPPHLTPSATAAAAPVELKPLVVVQEIEVNHADGTDVIDLYGSVKIGDAGESAKSVVFDRGVSDTVSLQSYKDAPVSSNGLTARHGVISVDLWDHWSWPWSDRPVGQGTIDVALGHDGINYATVYGRGKAAVSITYSKHTSWQKTTIDKVVLKDSDDNPAQMYGRMSASVAYTDQRNRKSTLTLPLYDLIPVYWHQVRHGDAIWSQSSPLALYTDTGDVTVSADLWDYNSFSSNDHIASGTLTISPTYSTHPVQVQRDIKGPDGAVTVYYTTVRETENPAAAAVTTFAATASETGAYWTPATMRAATPYVESGSTASRRLGHSEATPSPRPRDNMKAAFNRAVGVLFFRDDGVARSCSGVSVPSVQGDQVETAAHCVLHPNGHATDIVFVPGYDGYADNPAPEGIWRYRSVSALNGWVTTHDRRFDQAIIKVWTNAEGQTLSSQVGTTHVLFDQDPTQAFVSAQGYSSVPQGGAMQLNECFDSAHDVNGMSSLPCHLSEGSSGGPMSICDPFDPSFYGVYAVIAEGNPFSDVTAPFVRAYPQSLLLRDLMMQIDSP